MKKKTIRKTRNNYVLVILLFVGLLSLGLAGYFYFPFNNIVHTNQTFPNAPTYPIGTFYYSTWEDNLMKFDEKTKSATKLAHITDDWVKFTLSKSKDFFYVLDGGNVWKMDLQGKKIAKLVDGSGKIKSYIVSPDESMIAYELSSETNNDTIPTQTNQYVLDLKNKTILPIPLYKQVEVNAEYNTGGVYMLGEWLDNETIIKKTSGSPRFTWNLKTHLFGKDTSTYMQMYDKWGSGRHYFSPDKKYQVIFNNNGIIVYDNKDNVIFDKYDYHKFNDTEYQEIGWTPDSRFYAFKMLRSNPFEKTLNPDAIGVIDVINRKTYQYSLELLPIPNKNVEMGISAIDSRIIESGKIYFIVRPTGYGEKQKMGIVSQAWVFDIVTATFEKVGNVKDKSDSDFSYSSLIWIK